MTTHTHQPNVLLGSALALAAAGAFLLPGGSTLPHLFFELAALSGAAWLASLAYAAIQEKAIPSVEPSLRAEVAWVALADEKVLPDVFEGAEPLVALVHEGQVPHPEMVRLLTPYFADPNVAFVQGATRFDGEGGVADAFRSQSAIGAYAQLSRDTLNAVRLTGSGAIVSREAAREVYRPGDTWETLGMRLVASGYSGRFVAEPVVLAWAPENLSAMGGMLVADARNAAVRLYMSLRLNLPFSTRLQYAAAAMGPASVWCGAAAAFVSALSLVFFDVGPVILTSPGAWVGDAVALVAAVLGLRAWMKLVGINPLIPAALALSGASRAAYDYGYALATGPRARRAWAGTASAARTAYATVRAGGNAGTAPAGTPARS